MLAVAACAGSSKPAPTTTTSQPAGLQPAIPAPPADDARKAAFPTDEQCRNAVDRAFILVKADPAKAKEIEGHEGEFVEEGIQLCNYRWSLAQVDCMLAASTFTALDACLKADYEPSDSFDRTTAIGHASEADCTAMVENLAAIGDDQEERDVVGRCQRSYPPLHVQCLRAAKTKEDASACRDRL